MSEVAGKSMIVEKVQKFDKTLTKSSPVVAEIVKRVKDLEHDGYQFEGADASFEILVRKAIWLPDLRRKKRLPAVTRTFNWRTFIFRHAGEVWTCK